jgi:hypothetical protein
MAMVTKHKTGRSTRLSRSCNIGIIIGILILCASMVTYAAVMSNRILTSHQSHETLLALDQFVVVDRGVHTTKPSTARSLITAERKALYQYTPPKERFGEELSAAAQECGTSPDFNDYFAQNLSVRSRLNEDLIIYNRFFKQRFATASDEDKMKMKSDFTYVELGGFTGRDESNSRFFDRCLGWQGLLIEPNPSAFPILVQNRPYAHRMSFAASCSIQEEAMNKTVSFLTTTRPFSNAPQLGTENAAAYKGRKAVDVPCGSLTPVLLDLFPGGHVSFFSLDVEGVSAVHYCLFDYFYKRRHHLCTISSLSHCVSAVLLAYRQKPWWSRTLISSRSI